MASDPDRAEAPTLRANGARKPAPSGAKPGAETQRQASDNGLLARHKRLLQAVLLGALMFGFFYYVLPQIVGLGPTLRRLRSGNGWWLGLGVPLEAISIAAYVALFRAVFGAGSGRIGWRASYQITMAGGAATKFFAAAGSGGVALTVWALRASGLSSRAVAQEMVCFEIVNYGVYMFALVICGFGLWSGLFPGRAPALLTLVPALFGLAVIVCVLSMHWLAAPAERFALARTRSPHARLARFWARMASVPRSLHDGLDLALALLRTGPSWLQAIPAWGFDIATLWASFRAFGPAPSPAVLIMGYYVGTLGNTLPLPAGIGGVEGGMIGAFIGFGVESSLAVIAVLAYRTISYWLPLLPEGISYLRLRHTVGDWRRHPSSTPARSAGAPAAGAGDPA